MKVSGWRTCLPGGARGAALCGWLREPASLTTRLQRRGRFRIQLLWQRLHHANADECSALGLTPDSRCWVREVVLFCGDEPLIFAHTVLPIRPRGVLTRWFARLGSRSLGSLLFAHPGFFRGHLTFSKIDARHPLHAAAISTLGENPVGGFLARRCTHRFHDQTVLVTEVFSPRLAKAAASA